METYLSLGDHSSSKLLSWLLILAVDQFLVAELESSLKHVQVTCIHDGGGDKQVLEDST